mmetsp:Transcript_33637/g.104172  ORF Transcript_33637/g.104172 Transcript_33637/m.104172 type:complete len:370 (+) Transcript_33637:1108-2217(+)
MRATFEPSRSSDCSSSVIFATACSNRAASQNFVCRSAVRTTSAPPSNDSERSNLHPTKKPHAVPDPCSPTPHPYDTVRLRRFATAVSPATFEPSAAKIGALKSTSCNSGRYSRSSGGNPRVSQTASTRTNCVPATWSRTHRAPPRGNFGADASASAAASGVEPRGAKSAESPPCAAETTSKSCETASSRSGSGTQASISSGMGASLAATARSRTSPTSFRPTSPSVSFISSTRAASSSRCAAAFSVDGLDTTHARASAPAASAFNKSAHAAAGVAAAASSKANAFAAASIVAVSSRSSAYRKCFRIGVTTMPHGSSSHAATVLRRRRWMMSDMRVSSMPLAASFSSAASNVPRTASSDSTATSSNHTWR